MLHPHNHDPAPKPDSMAEQALVISPAIPVSDADPAEVIANYQRQGYVLPAGFTVERVIAEQQRLDINPIFVPLGHTMGVIAWGVPFIDGQPLQHPQGLKR